MLAGGDEGLDLEEFAEPLDVVDVQADFAEQPDLARFFDDHPDGERLLAEARERLGVGEDGEVAQPWRGAVQAVVEDPLGAAFFCFAFFESAVGDAEIGVALADRRGEPGAQACKDHAAQGRVAEFVFHFDVLHGEGIEAAGHGGIKEAGGCALGVRLTLEAIPKPLSPQRRGGRGGTRHQ